MENIMIFRIVVGIAEILALSLGFFCFIKAYRRFLSRRNRVAKLFLIFSIFVFLTPLMHLFDVFFYKTPLIEGIFSYDISYGYGFAVLSGAFLNISLLYFASEVFIRKEEQSLLSIKLKILYWGFNIGQIAPVCIYMFLKFTSQDNSLLGVRPSTLMLAIQILLGVTLYILLSINSFKLIRKIKEGLFRISIYGIGIFSLLSVFVYILFIVDSFTSLDYTLWGVAGWIIYFICVIFEYIAFIRPVTQKSENT